MKLSHPIFEFPIEFNENTINVLVVENQKIFTDFIMDLLNQTTGKSGEFVLSENIDSLNISKELDLIIDIFSIDLNQKKILTKLYSILKNKAMDGEHYLATMDIISNISRYLEEIIETIEYPLLYTNEFDIGLIFKVVDLRLNDEYESLFDKITNYISIMREIAGISCFVFVNLKSFISDIEIAEIYKFAFYQKINIILLESTYKDVMNPYETIRIIDTDLCEIHCK